MNNESQPLRSDLTFEEFRALASREPNLSGDWVYRLTSYLHDGDESIPYPKFNIWVDNQRLFRTLAEAETFMRNNVMERIDEPVDFYCHTITQVPIGESEARIGAQWLYNPYGELLDYSITSRTGNAEDCHFFGRSAERIRFKKGDIVEVRDHRSVHLATVVCPMASVQDCWKIYQRSLERGEKFDYPQDASDDQCVVIDGPGYEYHEHVSPLRLMRPCFWVDENLRLEMQEWLEKV